MLTTNHKWLRSTPFVATSYPDVAHAVINAVHTAGLKGIDRWGITKQCPNIASHKLRITIGQLESYGVLICDGRTYRLGRDLMDSIVVGNFNSTQARLLGYLSTLPAGKSATASDINSRFLIERSQLQPAARRLESKGLVNITLAKGSGTRTKIHYMLNDLSSSTVKAVLDLP